MPNLPCARSTGKGSTLGPLTKHRRVGTGPTLGQDCLNCLNRKPRQFPMVLAHCGQKMRENIGKLEKRKSGRNPCSEGGKQWENVFLSSSYKTTCLGSSIGLTGLLLMYAHASGTGASMAHSILLLLQTSPPSLTIRL